MPPSPDINAFLNSLPDAPQDPGQKSVEQQFLDSLPDASPPAVEEKSFLQRVAEDIKQTDIGRAVQVGTRRLLHTVNKAGELLEQKLGPVPFLQDPSKPTFLQQLEAKIPRKEPKTVTESLVAGTIQEAPLLPFASTRIPALFALGASGAALRAFQEDRSIDPVDVALEGAAAVALGKTAEAVFKSMGKVARIFRAKEKPVPLKIQTEQVTGLPLQQELEKGVEQLKVQKFALQKQAEKLKSRIRKRAAKVLKQEKPLDLEPEKQALQRRLQEIDRQIEQVRQSPIPSSKVRDALEVRKLRQQLLPEPQVPSQVPEVRAKFASQMQALQQEQDAVRQALQDLPIDSPRRRSLEKKLFNLNAREVRLRQQFNSKVERLRATEESKLARIQKQRANAFARDSKRLRKIEEAFERKKEARIKELTRQKQAVVQQMQSRVKQLKKQQRLLMSRRRNLLEKLKREEGERFRKLVNQIEAIDNKVIEIENFDKAFARPIVPKELKTQIVDAALEQAQKVDLAAQKGLISKAVAPTLKELEFINALKAQGLDPSTLNRHAVPFGSWLNTTTLASQIQKRLGVRTGETAERLVAAVNRRANLENRLIARSATILKRLNDAGVDDDSITRLLQYYRDKGFDPSRLFVQDAKGRVKLDIPELSPSDRLFQLAQNPQVDEAMRELRSFLDEMTREFNLKRLEAYTILRRRATPTAKPTVDSIREQTAALERTKGRLDPLIHETDFKQLITRYIREGARHKFVAPVLNDALRDINALRLLGADKPAKQMIESLFKSLNIDDAKAASIVLGDELVRNNRFIVDDLIKRSVDADASTVDEIYSALYEAMAANLVATNPRTIILQALQPEIIGNAELGPKYVQVGRRLALSKKANREVDHLLKSSLVEDVEILAEQLAKQPAGTAAKIIRGINIPTRFLSKIGFGKIERLNRLSIIHGARKQFEDALAANRLPEILADLTEGERQLVARAFREAGSEAAKDWYAVIRSRRVNFAYNLADKPIIFSKGLGKYVPFTTFVRNTINRTFEDVSEGNFKRGLRRIMGPIVGAYILSQLTGRDLGSAVPAQNILDVARFGGVKVGGPLVDIAEEAAQGRIQRALGKAAEAVTPISLGKKLSKPIFPRKR